MTFPTLRCAPCGLNEDHKNCHDDGICRCGCDYNKSLEISIYKLKIAKESQN